MLWFLNTTLLSYILVGPITVRTHSSRRVVNRSSRFHTSAGLDDLDQATTGSGRHSPCNSTVSNLSCSPNGSPLSSTGTPLARESLTSTSTSNNGLVNPRLPPLPHSYLVHPLAQIRTPDGPRCGGSCCTQSSNKCNGRVGLEYSVGAAMKFAPSRGWLGGSSNSTRAGKVHSQLSKGSFISGVPWQLGYKHYIILFRLIRSSILITC